MMDRETEELLKRAIPIPEHDARGMELLATIAGEREFITLFLADGVVYKDCLRRDYIGQSTENKKRSQK